DKIIVEGKVDRVDIANIDSDMYFRIIDYKTGVKDYNFSDLLYGINIQMLIYMAAISENGKQRYNNAKPAGVLYVNVKRPIEQVERNRLLAKTKSNTQGVILDTAKVIDAMDKNKDGKSLAISYDKKGNIKSSKYIQTVNKPEMDMIKNKVKSLIKDIPSKLKKGDIKALPLKEDKSNGFDACKWCDYKSVCLYEDNMEKISFVKIKKDMLIKQLKEEQGDNKNGK
ncbi:MAG: PD-(D/E)XK nuclease family protein, partial [Clostridia bacterium]|nr:PD-(D/E)XK nuclease family protein [Clostridia bacterium]